MLKPDKKKEGGMKRRKREKEKKRKREKKPSKVPAKNGNNRIE